MQCRRCRNAMVTEIFEDRARDFGPGSFVGWRCVACGAIVDPLILAHQRERPEPRRQGPRISKGRLGGGAASR